MLPHQDQRHYHRAATNRASRKAMGQEILQICRDGFYTIASTSTHPTDDDGAVQHPYKRIDIREPLEQAIAGTIHYPSSHNFPSIVSPNTERKQTSQTRISVQNTSTLRAALHMARDRGCTQNQNGNHVGVLNFASAKNPGGGFLGGSSAQEESLCFGSLLYPTLQQFEATPDHYYQINRRPEHRGLYTSCAIFSPRVPVVRDEANNNEFLDEPVPVSFVTIPAPNKGACLSGALCDEATVTIALEERVRRALAIFAEQGCTHLVLGAFGCGVFRNDPVVVARTFRKLLDNEFQRVFEAVIFAVLVSGKGEKATQNIDAFYDEFAPILSSPTSSSSLTSTKRGSSDLPEI